MKTKSFSAFSSIYVKSMVLLAAFLLILALPAPSVSAKPLVAPAVDGDGQMTVLPLNATYASTGNSFTFTFMANNDFGAGSQVVLTVPSGWTAPTKSAGNGHVSVASSGLCILNADPLGVTGFDIAVDMVSCPAGETFTLTYAGVKIPAVSGSPYTFLTQTDIGSGGGGLTPINAGSPQVTVDARPLTVSATGLTPASKTYDGTQAATLTIGAPTLVGVVSPDVVTLDTTGATASFVDKNVGNAKVVDILGLALAGANAANYTLTQPTRTANITPLAITVTAATDSKTYDGTTTSTGLPALSGATPLAAGDGEPAWTQVFANKNAGVGKALIPAGVVSDGNNGANYTYNFVPNTTGVINALAITITAVTDTKVYDGALSSVGVPTLSAGTPLASGDLEPTWTQAFNDKNVGTGKTLTPAGAVIDGNGGANYAYTFIPDTTGVIQVKPVTVAADAKYKAVGAADPALTYHLTNGAVFAPDTFTGVLSRAAGETVGQYDILQNTLALGSNYALTYVGAKLTILPPQSMKLDSIPAQDGWVLESAETSNKGGAFDAAAATFQLGDNALKRQYKALLSFNTAPLPNNAIIVSAVLKIKQFGAPVGSNPFQTFGNLLVDIKKGSFGFAALAKTDFEAPSTAAKVAFFKLPPVSGWYSATLSPVGRASINTTGVTQFRLYFAKDDNNNLVADYVRFLSGDSTTGKPQLIITYITP
jgi:hypothetical protein